MNKTKKRSLGRKKQEKSGNFFEVAKKQLSQERLERAHAKALSEIFAIRLAQLRENQGLAQTEIKGFTQSNVSRLEARDDMKLSTLIQYLQSIGLDVEITVKPHGSHLAPIKLLKTEW